MKKTACKKAKYQSNMFSGVLKTNEHVKPFAILMNQERIIKIIAKKKIFLKK